VHTLTVSFEGDESNTGAEQSPADFRKTLDTTSLSKRILQSVSVSKKTPELSSVSSLGERVTIAGSIGKLNTKPSFGKVTEIVCSNFTFRGQS